MGITAPAATRQAGERNMRGRKRQSTGIDRQLTTLTATIPIRLTS